MSRSRVIDVGCGQSSNINTVSCKVNITAKAEDKKQDVPQYNPTFPMPNIPYPLYPEVQNNENVEAPVEEKVESATRDVKTLELDKLKNELKLKDLTNDAVNERYKSELKNKQNVFDDKGNVVVEASKLRSIVATKMGVDPADVQIKADVGGIDESGCCASCMNEFQHLLEIVSVLVKGEDLYITHNKEFNELEREHNISLNRVFYVGI